MHFLNQPIQLLLLTSNLIIKHNSVYHLLPGKLVFCPFKQFLRNVYKQFTNGNITDNVYTKKNTIIPFATKFKIITTQSNNFVIETLIALHETAFHNARMFNESIFADLTVST